MGFQGRFSGRGFSLIEVLVVVAIIALLLALAVPALSDTMARQRGRGAVEGMRAVLQWGRSEAIRQNAPIFVTVVPGTDWCYALSRVQGCGCAVACADEANLLRKVTAVDFPGVNVVSVGFLGTLCGVTKCTRFEPQRGTAQGSNGSVVVEAASGERYKILVATMGRVRVCVLSGDSGSVWPQC